MWVGGRDAVFCGSDTVHLDITLTARCFHMVVISGNPLYNLRDILLLMWLAAIYIFHFCMATTNTADLEALPGC